MYKVSSLKKLFIPPPNVTWLGLRGPSTLRAPYRLFSILSIILYFLPSALCEEQTSTRDLKCEPEILSKRLMVIKSFMKEDKNN